MNTRKANSGEIITFYSYKGGTGRSMALANVACLLAESELDGDILMIDWDLDAPGLHRYFQDFVKNQGGDPLLFERQLGLIDLFLAIKQSCENQKLEDDDVSDDFFDLLDVDKFIVPTDLDSLFLMSAGKLDNSYSHHVNNFDWENFFNNYPTIISKFSEYLSKRYKYVLVDSRTGYTDISGICTTLMPNKLVVVFTPNRQSISGVLDITKMSVEYRKQSDDLRPLITFPLVSRVEPAEPKLREIWRFGNQENDITGYQNEFQDTFLNIYNLKECNLTSYFDEVQIQYIPRYSYGEEVAVLAERSEDRLSLARSYESFVKHLIGITKPWDITSKSEETADIDQKITHRKGGRVLKTVYICYRRTNFYSALAVYQGLTKYGYDVFFDYQSIASGNFENIIFENIKHRAHFIIMLSPSALDRLKEPNSIMRREVETAIVERRNIIPIMMEGFDFGSTATQEALTGKLAVLPNFNGVGLVPDYFDASLEKLRKFLNVPIEDISSVALSHIVEKDTEEKKEKVNQEPLVDEGSLVAEEWFERGVDSLKRQNFGEALRSFQEAINLEKDINRLAIIHSNIGTLYADQGLQNRAKEAYRKAIEFNPKDATIYSNLGSLLSEQQSYEKAEEAYRKAIELNPKSKENYTSLGNLLSELKRYEEAEGAYQKAKEINN